MPTDYTKPSLRDIGWAVKQMWDGERVRRAGWNATGMWIGIVGANWSGALLTPRDMEADWQGYSPFIVLYAADKKLIPWDCSQADLLAIDWETVPV